LARPKRWRGRSLHPAVREAASAIVHDLAGDGVRAVVTSGYRSLAKQRALYRRYLRGGTPAAPPGQSPHNFGLAVDIALPSADPSTFWGWRAYRKMHAVARRHGLEPLSGALAREDPYHLEIPGWRQLAS